MPLLIESTWTEDLVRSRGVVRLRPYITGGVTLEKRYAYARVSIDVYFADEEPTSLLLYFVLPLYSPPYSGFIGTELNYKKKTTKEYETGIWSFVEPDVQEIRLIIMRSIMSGLFMQFELWNNMYPSISSVVALKAYEFTVFPRLPPHEYRYIVLPRLLPLLLF